MSRILKTYANKITSPFGYRVLNGVGQGHGGIDIVGTTGSNSLLDHIIAHSDGEVVKVVSNITGFVSGGSYGNQVIIKHDDTYSTLYAHMGCGSVTVNVGDNVQQGQTIGYMGATGTSYGGHLHFEVRENGNKIDPKKYIDADLPIVKKDNPVENIEEDEEMAVVRYNNISEVPVYAKITIQKLIDRKYISDANALDLSLDMVRGFVINDRAGLYK